MKHANVCTQYASESPAGRVLMHVQEAKDWEAQRKSALERCRADLASQRESQLSAIRNSNQGKMSPPAAARQCPPQHHVQNAADAQSALKTAIDWMSVCLYPWVSSYACRVSGRRDPADAGASSG